MQKEKDNIDQLRKRLPDCEALILRLAKSFFSMRYSWVSCFFLCGGSNVSNNNKNTMLLL